jgi:hypothetical protein
MVPYANFIVINDDIMRISVDMSRNDWNGEGVQRGSRKVVVGVWEEGREDHVTQVT